jgi:hypothetical protein
MKLFHNHGRIKRQDLIELLNHLQAFVPSCLNKNYFMPLTTA